MSLSECVCSRNFKQCIVSLSECVCSRHCKQCIVSLSECACGRHFKQCVVSLSECACGVTSMHGMVPVLMLCSHYIIYTFNESLYSVVGMHVDPLSLCIIVLCVNL